MRNKVSPKLCRVLQIGCGKTIVDIQYEVVLLCQPTEPFQINDIQRGVGRCLYKNHPGVGLDFLFPLLRWICDVNIRVRNSNFWKNTREDLVGRAEHGARSQHVVTGLQQGSHADIHSSHTRGRSDAVFRSFQQTKFVDKFGGVRV